MPETHEHFSDEEMHLVHRYGQALGGAPTPFEEEVERELSGQGTGHGILAEVISEAGPDQPEEKGPLPPQESIDQPTPQGGKKGGGKPPSGTTPTAIGEQAVQPEEPSGEF